MVEQSVRTELREFISSNYLFGDVSRFPGDEDSLLERGILDAAGVLELIEFLESQYGIEVDDDETVLGNLDSISGLTRFVLSKRALV